MKKNKLNLPTKPQTQNVASSPVPTVKGKLNLPGKTSAQQGQLPSGGRPPSIMIAVPSMEMVNAEFAQHLAMAAANLVAHGIKINCAFNIGSVITIARRNLVDIFLKSDFDYIWWVDSDMKFPIDSPIRLLKRNKDIVGVNYRRRRFPNANFTGMVGTNGSFKEFHTTDNSPAMELIDVLPHGCVLVKRHVYERIPQPHYIQEFIPSMNLEIGEDIFFCQQAQKAGFEVWCDQELSREVAHIGIFHFNYNLTVPKG